MKPRFSILLPLVVSSCAEGQPSAEQCKALSAPEEVMKRCLGGSLDSGVSVPDEECWPFSKPMRLKGVWVVELEGSTFFRDAKSVKDIEGRHPDTWLAAKMSDQRSDVRDAMRGAGTRVYVVDLEGRQALCDGMFGHMGGYKRQVIAERFYSIQLIDDDPNRSAYPIPPPPR